MKTENVQVGSTITNGSSALRVNRRVEHDPRWGTPSWEGISVALEEFGGMNGMLTTVPDYLLGSWRHVPFEWAPVVGGALEERYVWAGGYRWLQREVRRAVQPTVDGIRGHQVTTAEEDEVRRRVALAATPLAPFPVDCRSKHGEGHPDCPKCWPWSDRNPNSRPRPVTS